MNRFRATVSAALLILYAQSTAAAPSESSAVTPAISIAVMPFEANRVIEQDVAQIIDDDLRRTGDFRTIARADLTELLPGDGKHFERLNAAGVRFAVTGTVDTATVRFYVWDVAKAAPISGFDVPIAADGQLRYVAHQIADLVYEHITGTPGIANTKLVHVSKKGSGAETTYTLVICDADGANPSVVAASREPIMSPAWSPDRNFLAFVGYERGQSAVYILTLADGSTRKISSEKGINGSPAWSPDGQSLAVTQSVDGNAEIYVIELASGKKRRLTDDPGIDTEPSWAPDGKTIAFTSDREGTPRIYHMPAEGGTAKLFPTSSSHSFRPTYSPDGHWLAFVAFAGRDYQIALLDLRSDTEIVISDGPWDQNPSFAPNGRAIVYSTVNPNGSALEIVSIPGLVRQVIKQDANLREPAWSPMKKP